MNGFFFCLLLAIASWLPGQVSGQQPGTGDDLGVSGTPMFPPANTAWLFFDPGVADHAAVRDRVRSVARVRGHSVREFDLSRPNYARLLADIQLARGIRKMARFELFVGERAVLGEERITSFLSGWQAGTETLILPAEPEIPKTDPSQDTPPEDPSPDQDPANAGTPPVPPRSSNTTFAQPDLPKVEAASPWRTHAVEWLGRYKWSALVLLASALLFVLSLRRKKKST